MYISYMNERCKMFVVFDLYSTETDQSVILKKCENAVLSL